MEKQKDGLFQLDNGNWGYRIKCKIRNQKVDIKKVKDIDGYCMPTRQDAKVAQAKHLAILSDTTTNIRKKITYTYDDVWKYYLSLDLVGKKEKALDTLKRQESLWRVHVGPRFGSRIVSDVSCEEIQGYLNELYYKDHYSIEYVKGFVKFFILLINEAYRMHALSLDEYEILCVHKATRFHTPIVEKDDDIDEDDIDSVEIYEEYQIKQLDEYFDSSNLEIAYKIAMYCGLRVSEIFAITWDNVDLVNKTIKVTRQLKWDYVKKCWYLGKLKTKASKRVINIPQDLCDLLKKEQKRQLRFAKEHPQAFNRNNNWEIEDRRMQIHTWVPVKDFINKKEKCELITNNSVKYHTKNASDILGYRVHFHAFRHTFISRLARSGCDKKLLMDITGHSKFSTVEKYYEGVFDSSKQKAREIIELLALHSDFDTSNAS